MTPTYRRQITHGYIRPTNRGISQTGGPLKDEDEILNQVQWVEGSVRFNETGETRELLRRGSEQSRNW